MTRPLIPSPDPLIKTTHLSDEPKMTNPSSNNHRIAKNTVALYFRMLLTLAVSLFTSRVILDSLGVEDYGIYNLVGGFVTIFNIIRAGLLASTQRFITYDLGKGNIKVLKDTFSTCVIIFVFISLLIVIIAEAVGVWFIDNKLAIPEERMGAAHWVFQLSLATLVITLISYPYNALIIAHEHMKVFAYISIYEAFAKLAVAYALYVSPFDKLIIFAILLCVVQLTVRFFYNSYCLRNFEEAKVKWRVNRTKIKSILGFTGWEMFGSVANMGYTQGLNVLLGIFFNPVVNAARGIAVQVQSAIVGFVNSFQTAINPQITKSYASNNKGYMYYLIFAGSRFSYYLLFIFALPIFLEANQVLNIWLKTVPEYSVLFFRIIIIVSMIDAISNSVITSVEATGNIKKYQIIVGGILLMIVPVAYVVLKLGGEPYTVFLVHFVFSIIALIARLIMGHNIVGFRLSYFMRDVLLPIVMVSFISIIPPILVYSIMSESFLRLVLVILMSVISILLSVFFVGIKKEEKQMLISKVQSMMHK